MRTSRSLATAFGLLLAAAPAGAQWTRVDEVPASVMFSVRADDATIVAGADSVVHVSTDAGASWKHSVRVAAGVTSVQAALLYNGRLYAGAFGQGVWASDDVGDSWQPFSQGLGIGTPLFISDLLAKGDSLYAATSGAGVFVRNLTSGSWVHFGEEFEPNQSSNVNGLAQGGTRLIAAAGPNGSVFFRDPGDVDWTISWLNNVGLEPGLSAFAAAFTADAWVVGANVGVFRSTLGQEPWTFVDVGLGTLFNVALATGGGDVFAAFANPIRTVIEHSIDDGANWQVLDTQDGVFVSKLAISGTELYAARGDGLWRRSTTTAVKPAHWGSVKSRFR